MEDSSKAEAGCAAIATAGGDMRAAKRVTLMLRVAKIVGENFELPCIIRDVSSKGVRLRLFQQLAAETRLALELGNGEVFFIEKVWDRGDEAGFRFSADIDVEAFIAEASPYPRRQIRLRTHIPALAASRGAVHAVTLRDLSQNGAGIEASVPLDFDQRLRIDAAGLPTIEARVRWCSHPEYGVVFERTFRLDHFAEMIAALPSAADRPSHSAKASAARLAQLG